MTTMTAALCKAIGFCHAQLLTGTARLDLTNICSNALNSSNGDEVASLAGKLREFLKRAATPKDGRQPSYTDAVPRLSRAAKEHRNDVRVLALAMFFPNAGESDANSICGDGAAAAWKMAKRASSSDEIKGHKKEAPQEQWCRRRCGR